MILGVSLKLYMSVEQTTRWAREVADSTRSVPAVRDGAVQLFVLPSLPAVPATAEILRGTPIRWGAQDLDAVDRGARTGAISGSDLAEIGCTLVEVGHAERRQLYGETDELVAAKLQAALRNRLVPVLCIGEELQGPTEDAVAACTRQLEVSLALTDAAACTGEIIIAYEPVWAIGRPDPAPAAHVSVVTATLREWLTARAPRATVRVIYGGSAQPGVLRALGSSVDGLFLGRFAHDPASLLNMIEEAAGGMERR